MPRRRTLTLAALAALLAAPLPAQVAPLGALALPASDLRPAQASEDLVQVFADYYRRHPIGSTLAPSTLRVLSAGETAGLPALPSGQRYAETEGLIVKVDAAYKLLGIARRAPTTTAEAPAPSPAPDPAPAPSPDGGGATAEASANATVNITINEGDDDDAEEEPEDGSRAISVAEAEARGVRIPGGHRPEAGACRIWIPGTPPGRQPRGEVSCDTDDVPEGALLIRG